MSVVIETTIGDITVDLFVAERPLAAQNFVQLCKVKYYNFNLFHTIERGFIAQTGDPTGSGDGGCSIHGVVDGPACRFFQAETLPKIKHARQGLLSFVGNSEGMIASQFFITLGDDLTYLDTQHCVFGMVMEGLDVLEMLNETICDANNRPYKDIRITHTIILMDPFPVMRRLKIPERSPSPSAERLKGGRIAPDEDIDDTGKSVMEASEMLADKEAKARATILEMVGDIPKADMAPPENVLFICKLNPVTTDDDLEIIFGRFGKIISCEVIRDKKSGDSLQYAFIEFDNRKSCENAYFKMDNVLIDDRRIHVDFSQSVAKVKWHGKGRGITMFDDHGRKIKHNADLGKGIYKRQERQPRAGAPKARAHDDPVMRRRSASPPSHSHTAEKHGKPERGAHRGDRDRTRRDGSHVHSRKRSPSRRRESSHDGRREAHHSRRPESRHGARRNDDHGHHRENSYDGRRDGHHSRRRESSHDGRRDGHHSRRPEGNHGGRRHDDHGHRREGHHSHHHDKRPSSETRHPKKKGHSSKRKDACEHRRSRSRSSSRRHPAKHGDPKRVRGGPNDRRRDQSLPRSATKKKEQESSSKRRRFDSDKSNHSKREEKVSSKSSRSLKRN